ncbi:MAG: glycerophosphodiester phosphodiesterase [Christensenellales bacterium]|jgi:glycerophosphoryl diester phosphodiesterase
MKTRIWAHRGASAYAPENTLEAFALAAEMGADGVELDVCCSKDGEVVVCHDATIDRTSTGTGLVADHTLAELKEFSFGKRFPGFEQAKIPTLREVFALLLPTGLTVNVEIKKDSALCDGIEEKCIAIAKECAMEDRVLYSSFDHESLRIILKIKPDAKTGLLYGEDIENAERYAVEQGAAALHPHYKNLYKGGAIERAHAVGVKVHPWTVNAEEDIARLLDLGADAIITDKPDLARKIRDAR